MLHHRRLPLEADTASIHGSGRHDAAAGHGRKPAARPIVGEPQDQLAGLVLGQGQEVGQEPGPAFTPSTGLAIPGRAAMDQKSYVAIEATPCRAQARCLEATIQFACCFVS